MKDFDVDIDDEMYEKIKERMIESGAESINHCIQELVELGLKAEEKIKAEQH